MALDVGSGCVNGRAAMTQAWDHRGLLSLTEEDDNGRSHGGRPVPATCQTPAEETVVNAR